MAVTDIKQSAAAANPAGGNDAELAPTRKPLHEARHLPSDIYASPELYQREKLEIFMKDWICVARVEEIDKPGDYMTRRIIDEPVIIAGKAAGDIDAFANVYRHRGAELASGAGNLQTSSNKQVCLHLRAIQIRDDGHGVLCSD